MVNMQRHSLQQETLEQMLLRKLQSQTNDDGQFVYPGQESVEERTGSSLIELVAYAMRKIDEKPLDYGLFRDFLVTQLKIPPKLLFVKEGGWKQLL